MSLSITWKYAGNMQIKKKLFDGKCHPSCLSTASLPSFQSGKGCFCLVNCFRISGALVYSVHIHQPNFEMLDLKHSLSLWEQVTGLRGKASLSSYFPGQGNITVVLASPDGKRGTFTGRAESIVLTTALPKKPARVFLPRSNHSMKCCTHFLQLLDGRKHQAPKILIL